MGPWWSWQIWTKTLYCIVPRNTPLCLELYAFRFCPRAIALSGILLSKCWLPRSKTNASIRQNRYSNLLQWAIIWLGRPWVHHRIQRKNNRDAACWHAWETKDECTYIVRRIPAICWWDQLLHTEDKLTSDDFEVRTSKGARRTQQCTSILKFSNT